MRPNPVKRLLRDSRPAIGTWLNIGSPISAEAVATLGFDWLVVDTEHSPIGIETATAMFQAIGGMGGVPMVRIPANTEENFKRVLDAGAWGVVVPMVRTAEEAAAAVDWCKYPPAGKRSMAGSPRHARAFGTDPQTYFARANDEILLVIQLEDIEAVRRADAILKVPGLDACFIGPTDLSASMGLKPGYEQKDPAFEDALRMVREACKRHGVAPGIHTGSAAVLNQRIAEGFQFLALWSELNFMLQAVRAELAKVQRRPA